MSRRLPVLAFVVAAILAAPVHAQEVKESREQQLKRLIERFPDADANRDGTLTLEEAQAYRARMQAGRGQQPVRRPQGTPIAPTQADVHYGPHERQVLDFYQAKSDKPTPVIVYIHGGGFVAGDKRSINADILQGALDAGISVAAIHYRFVDGDKIIFPAPQLDGARSVQFLRSKAADWNIDPARIGCFGGSAGAGISMWIGFHDDLAKPDSADPVERQSTRIRVIGTMGGQGTYDPLKIKQLIGGRAHEHPSLLKVYGLKSMDQAMAPSPEIQRLYDEASAITHLTKDDPPLYMVTTSRTSFLRPMPNRANSSIIPTSANSSRRRWTSWASRTSSSTAAATHPRLSRRAACWSSSRSTCFRSGRHLWWCPHGTARSQAETSLPAYRVGCRCVPSS
jgi:acetyl esterase